MVLSETSVPLLNINKPIDVYNSVITFSTLLARSTRFLVFYSYYFITNKHWKNIMQISSFHCEHVSSWYPVIANLNNEQIFVIYVFSSNMFFNHDWNSVSFIINFIPLRCWKYSIAILRSYCTCVQQLKLSWPSYKLIVHVRGAKRTIQFKGFVKAISRSVFAFDYLINSTWKKTLFLSSIRRRALQYNTIITLRIETLTEISTYRGRKTDRDF